MSKKNEFRSKNVMSFRFFDILKPWPLSKLEELPGATGVIADDFGAALFALIITQMVSSYVI